MEVTGMIIAYAGSEPPDGWLLCDGSNVPKDDQFDALRKMVGDKLPDLKGAWSLSTGTSRTHTTSTQHGTSEQHGTSTADPGFGGRLSGESFTRGLNEDSGQSSTHGESHSVSEGESYMARFIKPPSTPLINFIIKA